MAAPNPWATKIGRDCERVADEIVNHLAGFPRAEQRGSTIRDLFVEKKWLEGASRPADARPKALHGLCS